MTLPKPEDHEDWFREHWPEALPEKPEPEGPPTREVSCLFDQNGAPYQEPVDWWYDLPHYSKGEGYFYYRIEPTRRRWRVSVEEFLWRDPEAVRFAPTLKAAHRIGMRLVRRLERKKAKMIARRMAIGATHEPTPVNPYDLL